jgi:hypothetical protein
MPSLRAAALGAALLATAASGILAQTARPPAVNTKPVYCWEGNAIFNITSQTAESVCADLYIVSPPNNPISECVDTFPTGLLCLLTSHQQILGNTTDY